MTQALQLTHIPKLIQLPPIPNDYNSRQHSNFLGRERMPGVLLIMAFSETYKDCGFLEVDHISCHIHNYSTFAISINHIIIVSMLFLSVI